MGTRVLVVDDSDLMRRIIIRCLNTVGIFEVTEACDGIDGLARFCQAEFDLVLTDWNMPNKNGLEFVKAVRRASSAVPVIMITAEAERQRVVEAIGAGVTDYLVKPFTSVSLRDKLALFVK